MTRIGVAMVESRGTELGIVFGDEGITNAGIGHGRTQGDIAAVDNPLAQQAQISIADLAKYPLVLLDLPQTSTYLMTLFEVLADRPTISLSTRSYETVRSAVAAGFGVSILNMLPMGNAMADTPQLVRRPLSDSFPAPHLVVADIYGASKPQFVKTLIQMVRQYFLTLGPTGFALTTPERSKGLFDFSKS